MITATGIDGKYLEYQGRPLVRHGNEIYLGDLSDKGYVFMNIMATENKLGVEVPTMILVQVIDTTTKKLADKKFQTMANSLSKAFELGIAWLDRYNR